MTGFQYSVCLALVLLLLLYCAFWLTSETHKAQKRGKRILICLGSGGHTTEMLKLLRKVNKSYERVYYVSSGDSLSVHHATAFEQSLAQPKPIQVRQVRRARRVRQSWLSTPYTTVLSFVDAVQLVYHDKPDLILCNGPGTCVVIAMVGLLFRLLKMKDCRIIFVESFARVHRLSLSGKILVHFVDRFLVMWPELAQKYTNAEYAGTLL